MAKGAKGASASEPKDRLMLELPARMLMLAAAWEDFAKKPLNDPSYMDELASVLIVADTLRDLTEKHQNLKEYAGPLGEIVSLLNDLTESPEKNELDKIQQSAASKISHMVSLSEKMADGPDSRRGGPKGAALLEQHPIPISKPMIAPGEQQTRHVYIVSADEEFVSECAVQIGHYGYSAHSFKSFDEFRVGMSLGEPVAVIADLDLVKLDTNELGGLGIFRPDDKSKTPVPLIVVGLKAGFHERLQAVRSGAAAFFGKPVNVSLLLDKLDAIISNAFVTEPFRVLVVDDSETMIRFLSRTLTQEGMSVHVELEPEKVLMAIAEFNPDLILMDMYMPQCDGQELSRIIRQYESYTSVPIVFLSSETNIKKQLAAMQIGADDFLTKPIDPEHLISSITTRVQRHRILSSFMVQDSLTGLLNHTKSKQRLEQTLQKSYRSKIPTSFAMVDIDKFKNVNDTYGHPTGDRVIKSLSRLLQRRLRKTDSLGRYGGEEFALIFWDADAQSAAKILDEIRADFAKIEHHFESKVFYCSFSGGVAAFPEYPDAQSISAAADKALYKAKRGGRNQVVIANGEE